MDKQRWIQGLLKEYERPLLRYVSRMVSESAAREVVQETFLRLWQQDPAAIESYVRKWLYTVCRNLALDHIKKEGRLKPLDESDLASTSTDGEDGQVQKIETRQKHVLVLQFLKELPESQQEVVRLKFEEDLSYKEIAEITGHTANHVGVILHEALKNLRNRMIKSAGGTRHEH